MFSLCSILKTINTILILGLSIQYTKCLGMYWAGMCTINLSQYIHGSLLHKDIEAKTEQVFAESQNRKKFPN